MIKKHIKVFILIACIFTASLFGGVFVNDSSQVATPPLQTNYTYEPTASATIPTSYDLRDYIDIGVENQNPYGICYAYASLTSLETYLALHYGEYYDFSELHFAVSLYKQAGYYSSISDALSSGGNFTHFVTYTQKDKSLVLEEEMPKSKYAYTSAGKSQMETDYNNINNNFYSVAKVNDTKTFKQYAGNKSKYTTSELTTFRNSVKQHIINYGSLTAGIYTNTSIFTNNTKYYKVTNDSLVSSEQAITDNINHLISIVGWDDTYNANGTWATPGAYLCLNSWGEAFGDDGYFYVSYDDYFIESTIQGIVDASLCTTNDKISTIANHPQNTFIMTHTFDYDIYFVNVFDTSKYTGSSITYIDTFVKGGTTKFYIKFFDNYTSAKNSINSITVMNQANSSKVGDYSIYYKHQLSSPLLISGNYMTIITYVENAVKSHSLGGFVSGSQTLGLEPTYYTLGGLGTFNLSDSNYQWNPTITGQSTEATLPLIIHTNSSYVDVPSFESDAESFIDSTYIQNNAIFYGKTISLNLTNAGLDSLDATNVKITKLYTNSFVDVTSNFDVAINSNVVSITQNHAVSGAFTTGNYLVSIPCDNVTIYRVISVQDVIGYSITYHLNGGTAVNPSAYTNEHDSLSLNSPTKAGYTFVGWYTDSALTQPFDCNNLPYTNLELYAKYDFALPTITSKSSNISVTYSSGFSRTISVTATHALLNEYNTLTYQWYYRAKATDEFTVLTGKTNNSITVSDVADSGFYACEVSVIITDHSLTSSTQTKTLTASENNQIIVNIKPYTYDMSQVKWNYTEAISYDAQPHVVEVINLPAGVTVNYTNNTFTNIGTYTASAELVYDDMNGNAVANPIDDLVWSIRKANIIVTIKDIVETSALSEQELNALYDCTIQHEYLPEGVESKQDIIDFLDLTYVLQDTDNQNIKTISATHKSFTGANDVYNIQIVAGQYRVVVYSLNSNNVISSNDNGFAQDCVFNATDATISDQTNKLLSDDNLTAIKSYDLTYSYLQDSDSVNVFIPLEREHLFSNLAVYMLQGDKLVKLDSTTTTKGISFTTNVDDATYIVVSEDYVHSTNTQMLILICIIVVYLALCVYAIISAKHHNKNNYI